MDRTKLAQRALFAAQEMRKKAKRSIVDPICIYDITSEMGVDVWFQQIATLEGMYVNSKPPRIIIGSDRPAGRRRFTCAHELGHHIFGHGTRIDEISMLDILPDDMAEDEFLVDAFAGFLLMPKLAIMKALSDKGFARKPLTAEVIYRVANLFGVGFQTLVSHLFYGLRLISHSQVRELQKVNLASLRAGLIGAKNCASLVVVDKNWMGRPVDVEIKDLVVFPSDVEHEGDFFLFIDDCPLGKIWKAEVVGRTRSFETEGTWATFVRIGRRRFAGRAQFRHLKESAPEPDDDL